MKSLKHNFKFYVSLALVATLVQNIYADDDETQAQETQAEQKINLGKSYVYGSMMKSKLDELNRNVYEIDKESIIDRGYRSTEDIFRYTPFVGLTNVGLGSNLDLRGQGNRANTSVQVLVNGIYANMLDSSHGVTPLNTLSPNAIESIEILPGGGAVMYGNGTRGGVVNIITQRRYEQPFFTAGLSYSNIFSSTGDNYNADAKFGAKVGEGTYVSLGAAYINRGGPREGDKTSGAEANFGLIKDFAGGGHTLSFDVDYFYGDIKTTPNNSFTDNANPSRDDRKTAGLGDFHNNQQRLDVSLGYKVKTSENSTFDIKAFYHLNKINYVDSVTILSSYSYMNQTYTNVDVDQSGSLFDDQKAGLMLKYDLKHTNGRFILGLDSIYQMSKRTMAQFMPLGQMTYRISLPFEGNKWSNALYAIEKYDFTKRFSLTGGARYENAIYDVDVTNVHTLTMQNGASFNTVDAQGKIDDSLHNFALELTPNFQYSDSGNLYFKYEKGYLSPSPNNLGRRSGRTYVSTDLKQEDYHTFELGLKDYFGEVAMISAAAYYTLTTNEFYTIGNAHSANGVQYGNYDRTQRAGLELFSEQYLFGGILNLSESFTYIDAKILKNGGVSINERIPYVSNYKGTFGATLNLGRHWSIWTQNTFYGNQKDISGDTIKAYSLTDLGLNARYGGLTVSAGVRNLFDTFYYSYYNGDSSDTIAGYGYLIGMGRSAFIEARYTF